MRVERHPDPQSPNEEAFDFDLLLQTIEKTWGFSTLRPLQEEAIRAEVEGRDSLVVMPTGGGKSLCFQAPAVHLERLTVVVSPLISLMKDQVDSLRALGVPALQIDSMQSETERAAARSKILAGEVRLLYVSPNRLLSPSFQSMLERAGVDTFVIDEAHCISQWGHDFWPEYRQLRRIKEFFPGASVHAYTATATEQVREDIAAQLGLKDPAILVGDFDRSNLSYRIVPRRDMLKQVVAVLDRHKSEAGIIYCIRKKDVDELTADLRRLGYDAVAYHAGLPNSQRHAAQERFANEECDLVVATVAFGMGIDRSDIRFVLHTGLPKSIEHYQQETGRAGRDGLASECVMLYSPADGILWRSILERSASERDVDPEALRSSLHHLEDIDRFSRGAVCRHRGLVEYFGQSYAAASCEACDLCLGETAEVADAQTIAKKILSCVARVKERFGVEHVVNVLRGADTDKIRSLGHKELSTWGLLEEHPANALRDWIYQLVAQDVLVQDKSEYPILRLNARSWEVMKDQRPVRLVEMVQTRASRAEKGDWTGVDRGLFEELRHLRKEIAAERGVAPFIIFSDAVLRQLASVRPSTIERMGWISGIGSRKLIELGDAFLEVIRNHCERHGLPMDVAAAAPMREQRVRAARPTETRRLAFELFRRGETLQTVIASTGRTMTTVVEYLADFIRSEKPLETEMWIEPDLVEKVRSIAARVGAQRLKPIYMELEGTIAYEEIRIALAVIETGE